VVDWELSLFNIMIIIGYYESFYAYLYFKSKEFKRKGRISVRVLNINEENAVTLNSFFFYFILLEIVWCFFQIK